MPILHVLLILDNRAVHIFIDIIIDFILFFLLTTTLVMQMLALQHSRKNTTEKVTFDDFKRII